MVFKLYKWYQITQSVSYVFFHVLVDGGFGQWSSFTECSRTCGSGVKTRKRYCNSPEPRGISAKNCTGKFKEIRHCKLAPCVGRLYD